MADKKKGNSQQKPQIKLSKRKREAMFEAYCERQTIRHVSHKCSIHFNTAKRYSRLDRWEERCAEIQAQANAKADRRITDELSKVIANYRAIRNAGLNHFLRELKSQLEAGKEPVLPLGVKALSMLERLIAFLEGKPDTRPDLPPVIVDASGSTDFREFLSDLKSKLGSMGAKELADKLADDV